MEELLIKRRDGRKCSKLNQMSWRREAKTVQTLNIELSLVSRGRFCYNAGIQLVDLHTGLNYSP